MTSVTSLVQVALVVYKYNLKYMFYIKKAHRSLDL